MAAEKPTRAADGGWVNWVLGSALGPELGISSQCDLLGIELYKEYLEDVTAIRYTDWGDLQTFLGPGISLRSLAKELVEDVWKQMSRHTRRQETGAGLKGSFWIHHVEGTRMLRARVTALSLREERPLLCST